MSDLLTILWKKKVGEEALIKVIRGERENSFRVKLAESPFY
jgi:hypothetical protein